MLVELHLLKMWLDCPVAGTDKRGRKTRTSTAQRPGPGTGCSATPSAMTAMENDLSCETERTNEPSFGQESWAHRWAHVESKLTWPV